MITDQYFQLMPLLAINAKAIVIIGALTLLTFNPTSKSIAILSLLSETKNLSFVKRRQISVSDSNIKYKPMSSLWHFVFSVDGVYVTTRGCSNFHWEDIESFIDHKNQPIRCFRKGLLERCFCQYDGCNPAAPTPMLNPLLHLIPWLTVFVSFPVYHSI